MAMNAFRVITRQAIQVIQPPDTIIITNTLGLGTWELTRPTAEELYHKLGQELGLEHTE